MKISNYHLGFLGFGHMAQIIYQAIDHAKLIPRSKILFHQRDPEKIKKNEMRYGITATSLKNLVADSDIIILGVRPHQASMVFEALKGVSISPSKMLVSVLAGLKLSYYQKVWNSEFVRVMPNVASGVLEGMTTLSFGPNASDEFQGLAKMLFSSVGRVLEVPESLMDISCAVAGSGPGFVFDLIHAAAKAGIKYGLSEEDALLLAAQTFLGAAKMIVKGQKPETLLNQIATPNGVTQAGLDKMRALHIPEHFQEVIKASMKRSIELSEDS